MFSVNYSLCFHYTWIGGLLFIGGCRNAKDVDEIDQDFIYTNYEMTYDSESDLTMAKARFRNKTSPGRQLKLTDGSNILFNNKLLPEVVERTQSGGRISAE